MSLSRRDLLRGLGGAAAASAIVRPSHNSLLPAHGSRIAAHGSRPTATDFPRKADFRIADGYTYINGAYTHPMPIAAGEAYHRVVDRRASLGTPPPVGPRPDPLAAFASLINAKPSEVSFIPNTSTGENLVVECLGIRRNPGNVVTDALHFEGALIHLYELQKQGLDLRVVMPRDNRIELRDLERVIDRNTKLVEVSLVSMYNGFQHDLKAVCELAHAHGAYVYADIIQGVGAVPFDVRATGVDFAASATYKWLMGDFGFAFFYVREELLGSVIQRPHWSYESTTDAEIHMSPTDPMAPKPVTWTPGKTASHYFQLGTTASAAGAALAVSIPYIQGLGVENIQRWRQPMIDRLQAEMPRLGFVPQTSQGTTGPIVTFAHNSEEAINRKLQAARVSVRVAPYWMRIAPSVFNDMKDIDRLLEALSLMVCAHLFGGMKPLLTVAMLLTPLATGRAQTLDLVGEKGAAKSLTLAELSALPQAEVTVTDKDSAKMVFRGPTLRSLVNLVGAPSGHEFRGPNMLIAIVAEASDGYKAAYMLAEVDEGFGNKNAILALTQDGNALPEKDGPFRVVMPGEEHRARWIRMVQRLRLVRVA